MKITPAHDFNDFEVGKRHDLPLINVLDVEGKLVAERQRGVRRRRAEVDRPRRDARACTASTASRRARSIVERLEAAGLLDKIEPHTHMVPHGDRSGVVIEPFLTDQWYVNAKALAEPAIAAVRDGKTDFVPKNWEKTYFDWMENIQPWCISRQLWWGHQIPAWYGPDGKVFVAETEDEALSPTRSPITRRPARSAPAQAHNMATHPDKREPFLTRDEDVLDTWFSSALWPFSTLGWPDETPEVKRYYPTTALVTGFDIIFFWVARMMMMGLHFMKEVPFQDVYIHAPRPRREGRQDVEVEGQRHRSARPDRRLRRRCAALHARRAGGAGPRHQAVAAARRGQPQLRDQAVERRALRRDERRGRVAGFDPKPRPRKRSTAGSRTRPRRPRARSPRRSKHYRFNDAAGAAYRFVWNVYCDWYLELAKPVLTGPDGAAKDRDPRHGRLGARRDPEAAASVHAVHHRGAVGASRPRPAPRRDSLLALAQWPTLDGLDDAKAEAEIGWVVDLVTAIRSVRAEMNIRPARRSRWCWSARRRRPRRGPSAGPSSPSGSRASPTSPSPTRAPQGSVQLLVRGEVAALPLKGVIDFAAERARLDKEMHKADADIKRVDAKLGNPNFVATRPKRSSTARRKSARRPKAAAPRSSRLGTAAKRPMMAQVSERA